MEDEEPAFVGRQDVTFQLRKKDKARKKKEKRQVKISQAPPEVERIKADLMDTEEDHQLMGVTRDDL
jgi:hypothetical protein